MIFCAPIYLLRAAVYAGSISAYAFTPCRTPPRAHRAQHRAFTCVRILCRASVRARDPYVMVLLHTYAPRAFYAAVYSHYCSTFLRRVTMRVRVYVTTRTLRTPFVLRRTGACAPALLRYAHHCGYFHFHRVCSSIPSAVRSVTISSTLPALVPTTPPRRGLPRLVAV